MGEAEKVETSGTRCRVPPMRTPETEVHVARLVGMELEPIPFEALAQHGQHAPTVQVILEAHDEVVSIPHHLAPPL